MNKRGSLGGIMLTREHLTRQIDLINPDKAESLPITIIGCGAIGSFLALALVKSGFYNLNLYDFDTVSIENMSNQFFRFKDIGQNKAAALRTILSEYVPSDKLSNIKTNERKFVASDMLALKGVLVVCVDTMSARKDIYAGYCCQMHYVDLVIDARMSAETLVLFSYNQTNKIKYAASLFDDAQAVQEVCTAKSTVYTATLAGGMITKTIKNYLMGEKYLKSLQWNIKACEPFTCWAHDQTKN